MAVSGAAAVPVADLGYEQARDELVTVVQRLESGAGTLEDPGQHRQVARLGDRVGQVHEHEPVRRNRLGFLALFYKQFRKIADFSEIVTENKSV